MIILLIKLISVSSFKYIVTVHGYLIDGDSGSFCIVMEYGNFGSLLRI